MRERGGGGGNGRARARSIPLSQISRTKAEVSRADWLKDQCDFRGIDSSEVEGCCYYEYFRESAAMRKTLVLPTCEDQTARSRVTFVLNKAGWQEAANKNEAPVPWTSLNAQIKREIARSAKRCVERVSKHPKWHRPLLVEEFWPGHDPVELESQLGNWKKEAYYSASPGRSYLFGLFRLDETYNETQLARAFKALFRKRYRKTKGGGGPQWRSLLNKLLVMRIWRHERNRWKRLKSVAELCGYKGCIRELEDLFNCVPLTCR